MANEALTAALTRIAEKVSNVEEAALTTAMKTSNLTEALLEYNRHAPLRLVKDINADGSYTYSFPSGWVNDFSDIISIEYPAGTCQNPEDAFIAPEKYGEYRDATTRKLRFYEITPAAGNIIRVTFTAQHSIATTSTVYPNDAEAVYALAAAFCCFDLARRYAQDSESSIAADAVDRRGKSEKYLSVGKSLVNEFAVHFGLDKDAEVVAASANKNLDLMYPDKVDYLTHPVEER